MRFGFSFSEGRKIAQFQVVSTCDKFSYDCILRKLRVDVLSTFTRLASTLKTLYSLVSRGIFFLLKGFKVESLQTSLKYLFFIFEKSFQNPLTNHFQPVKFKIQFTKLGAEANRRYQGLWASFLFFFFGFLLKELREVLPQAEFNSFQTLTLETNFR